MAAAPRQPERAAQFGCPETVDQWHGRDPTPAGKWIIDFGWEMTQAEAAVTRRPLLMPLKTSGPLGGKTALQSSRNSGGGMNGRDRNCGTALPEYCATLPPQWSQNTASSSGAIPRLS